MNQENNRNQLAQIMIPNSTFKIISTTTTKLAQIMIPNSAFNIISTTTRKLQFHRHTLFKCLIFEDYEAIPEIP